MIRVAEMDERELAKELAEELAEELAGFAASIANGTFDRPWSRDF